MDMYKINQDELMEILKSYGIEDLIFDKFLQVEPDLALYIFHDDKNINYVLIAADYLDGYEDLELPCDFEFNYYYNKIVSFRAIRRFSYLDNATKKTEGYIDDDHLWTKASTGDVCMLYACDDLKYGK